MRNTAALALCGVLILTLSPPASSAPTPAQKCKAEVENASGKYAQCRFKAEATFTAKGGDVVKLAEALAKCTTRLEGAFTKATVLYGAACPMTENEDAFEAYLLQCGDDTVAAAGGASLPDYPAEIATCEGDLVTCDGSLDTCSGNLVTCSGNLGTCNTNLTTSQSNLAACQAEPPGQLGQTGQTSCWDAAGTPIACTGTGQDGELQEGLALSYTDNGDGTISDSNTGLVWEKLSDDGSIHDKDTTYTWTMAFASKVASLNAGSGFAGHTDWRLPNVKELASIVNYEAADPAVSPAFKTDCAAACTVLTCSCTHADSYWSSSFFLAGLSNAWLVGFFHGDVVVADKANSAHVRAVRGGS